MVFGSNPCIRCGKERIKGTEKTVVLNSSKTKVTIYICPDKKCQKIVEAGFAAKEERRASFAARRTHPPKNPVNNPK
ncbi:MAG: hypothetical protein A2Y57_02360 [Candidatus Woykebacteria bacterium RBG_13_40_7b]|uniref:YlxR domain-containing protein n=1 Tax=Candidatus Woykebacteria bacterium RBG_13_40_7b TaxID=1802594 RepID=A0A1G1WB71_9BACT|nr:MAG: hypothetical protein A2Y57_02360 [Candidatus Woykebacteria bacterium RBG_13_40_7b]